MSFCKKNFVERKSPALKKMYSSIRIKVLAAKSKSTCWAEYTL